MRPQPTDVAIVGGGASGVLLAAQLVRQGAGRVRVTLIDRGPEVGLGVAYGTACADHLLNIPASDMSALAEDPDHFVRWLQAGGIDLGDGFLPRQTYGRYLRDLLADTVWQSGARLAIVVGEVVAATEGDDHVQLDLEGGDSILARIAVLATGHRPPASDRGAYRGNPWLREATEGLASSASVLLIGTGLTMIDVVISLLERGHAGPITAISRRGLLPRSHPATPATGGPSAPETLFTDNLSERLARFREAARAEDGWAGVMQTLRPRNAELWQGLDRQQQRRFLRHLRPWWDVHRHRVAPRIGAAVDAAMAVGQLSILAGRIVAMDVGPACVGITIVRRGAATREVRDFDRVIDCSGPRNDVDAQSPLHAGLTTAGLLRPDPLGLGLEVADDNALIPASGVASTRLFALGPPTRGRHWEINAVPDIRRHAARMAEHLIRKMGRRP